jgi:hypothetical protein
MIEKSVDKYDNFVKVGDLYVNVNYDIDYYSRLYTYTITNLAYKIENNNLIKKIYDKSKDKNNYSNAEKFNIKLKLKKFDEIKQLTK